MAINFPDTPTTGDEFTAAGRTWVWDGTTWNNDATVSFDAIQLDTTAGLFPDTGEVVWDIDAETASVGLDGVLTTRIGQDLFIRVKNASGSVAIPVGTLVQFAGAAGDTVTVQPAITDGSVDHNYMVGITAEQIAADGFGFVATQAVVGGIDTNVWTPGTILYGDDSTAGNLTATAPTAPSFKSPVAAVVKQGAGSSGKILVRMDSGEGLDGLHNVELTSSANGEVLQYDGTKWVNATIDALPDQTGNSGTYLTTDGSTASWAAIEAGGDPKPDTFLLMGA